MNFVVSLPVYLFIYFTLVMLWNCGSLFKKRRGNNSVFFSESEKLG